MSYRTTDYVSDITENASWRKCFSPANLEKLLDFLIEKQWIPSQVSVNRALTELKFRRTDGGSAATDAQAAREAAQRNLDAAIAAVDAPPLTLAELEYFQSLGPRELSRLYYGPAGDALCDFAIRYNRAVREHFYRVPGRFSDQGRQ